MEDLMNKPITSLSEEQKMKNLKAEQLYLKFSDGWDFSPDAGNGYIRGEIFTPKYLVDMMLTDSGMFSDDAVFKNNYSTLSEEEILTTIQASVIEPAVGTANFLSEILWHKICYANELSKRSSAHSYELLVAEAVASIYANDIDAGNIQTAKSRLISGNPIWSEDTISFWTKQVGDNFAEADISLVSKTVDESLRVANERWGNRMDSGGVCSLLYLEHQRKTMPSQFESFIEKIIDNNFILFDSISRDGAGAVPGWNNVTWSIHNIFKDPSGSLSFEIELYAFALQVGEHELNRLEKEREDLLRDTTNLRQVDRLSAQIEKLKSELRELAGSANLPSLVL